MLDASALLAFLFDEAGGEAVGKVIATGCCSSVNLAEVLSRFARHGHDPAMVAARIDQTGLEIVPFSARHAEVAARLVPACRAFGLSLGDRACLALAIDRQTTAWTADRAWLRVDAGVATHAIR